MKNSNNLEIATAVLDVLPNPVLIKNRELEYVWINAAFEQLFSVKRSDVIGKLDNTLFPDRQVSQCNGGDLRVLEHGEMDHAVETVFDIQGHPRETITRKSKLTLSEDEVYLVGVMHDITDVTRANEALKLSEAKLQEQALKLAHIATTDSLTNCANRRALMDEAAEIVENQFKSAAVLMLDIDKFKTINDEYGHSVGDEVLVHFAKEVGKKLSATDHLYRYGGEEFVVVLDVENAQQAKAKAEAIREHIATTPLVDSEHSIDLSVSIGMVMKSRGSHASIENLLSKADLSLYKAKELGRNRVVENAA